MKTMQIKLNITLHARLALLAVLCAAGSVAAQSRAVLSTDTIALGDQTVLTVGQSDSYPSVEQLSQDGVLALGQEYDTATAEMHTVITSFEPGEHWLHVSPDDSLMLVVTDVEVDTTTAEIRDIASLERVPYTFWEVFRWVLLALVIVAIGLLVWWYLSHRPQVQKALGLTAPQDNRNPYERAADSLSDLRDRKVWQAGKVKEYYTDLTDIVRRFIEESTQVRATEMTSDETIEAVRTMTDDIATLRGLFAQADLVKFAKREPLPHEHEGAMDMAERFVAELWERVKPQPVENDREEAGHDA